MPNPCVFEAGYFSGTVPPTAVRRATAMPVALPVPGAPDYGTLPDTVSLCYACFPHSDLSGVSLPENPLGKQPSRRYFER